MFVVYHKKSTIKKSGKHLQKETIRLGSNAYSIVGITLLRKQLPKLYQALFKLAR